jgi:hypothetical protein
MSAAKHRDHADGRLPFLLELPKLRCAPEAQAGRLLRFLQLRQRGLPAASGATVFRLRVARAGLALRGVDQLAENAAVGDAVAALALRVERG